MNPEEVFPAPIGACSLLTLDTLASYGLDEETIRDLCAPSGSSRGCNSAQDCINLYLLGKANDASFAAQEAAIGLDVNFLLQSAFLVFMMQTGFAMVCAGCIRSKNCQNILLKNVLDACVGAIAFYLVGFAFAFGSAPGRPANGFIGNYNFALQYTTEVSASGDGFVTAGWQHFFFQWSFCAAATTILSGAVAERCSFGSYLVYSFFLSAFVYPVIVHWIWASQGWLSALNTSFDGGALILGTGAIDFAGSGVVHMTGGIAALVGAWMIGPRVGRFGPDGSVTEMKGHSTTLVVLGTFLLWFGWFGFNPGSNLVISSQAAATIVSRVAVTTALGGGAGGVSMLMYKWATMRMWDAVATCMGVLAGLVAVTAGCAVIEPWAAIIAGAVGAVIFGLVDSFTLNVLKVDDPVSAFPLHGAVGAWGVLFPGFLAKPQYVLDVYGAAGFGEDAEEYHRYGLFYGGHGQVLLSQFIEVLAICGWVFVLMFGFFFTIHKLGLLRVSMETELAGLDMTEHQKINAAFNNSMYGGRDDASHTSGDKRLVP